MPMNSCKHCQAEMVCEHVPANRTYLCPSCSCPNTFGTSEGATSLNMLSRRSLLWALVVVAVIAVAIGLLFLKLPTIAGFAGPVAFLVGAIAIYYGVRAFLGSRYQPFSTRSKYEASAGILGGSCLGITIGSIVTMSLCAYLVGQWFRVETSDLEMAARAWEATAEVEFPDSVELAPYLASKTITQKRIEFWDDKSFSDSRNRFYLLWINSFFTSQYGSREQSRQNLRDDSFRLISGQQTRGDAKKLSTEPLEWLIQGESREVSKIHWRGRTPKDESKEPGEFTTYQCLFDANNNTYCLTFLCILPDPNVSEAEIQKAFESFKPIGTGW